MGLPTVFAKRKLRQPAAVEPITCKQSTEAGETRGARAQEQALFGDAALAGPAAGNSGTSRQAHEHRHETLREHAAEGRANARNVSLAAVTPTVSHSNPVNRCARKYSANVHAEAKTKANSTGLRGRVQPVNAAASAGYNARNAQNRNAENHASGTAACRRTRSC